MKEANRLGRKYARKDMYASNRKYVDLKRRLEALLPVATKNEDANIRMAEVEYLETGDKDSLETLEYYINRVEQKVR